MASVTCTLSASWLMMLIFSLFPRSISISETAALERSRFSSSRSCCISCFSCLRWSGVISSPSRSTTMRTVPWVAALLTLKL